jgi:nicotinamide-nucleotide amidase
MAPVNEKQADVIEGARAAPEPARHRAGQRVDEGGKLLVLLPGPPYEMSRCSTSELLPRCASARRAVVKTRVLRIASMGESDVEPAVAPIYKTFSNPRTTSLARPARSSCTSWPARSCRGRRR